MTTTINLTLNNDELCAVRAALRQWPATLSRPGPIDRDWAQISHSLRRRLIHEANGGISFRCRNQECSVPAVAAGAFCVDCAPVED